MMVCQSVRSRICSSAMLNLSPKMWLRNSGITNQRLSSSSPDRISICFLSTIGGLRHSVPPNVPTVKLILKKLVSARSAAYTKRPYRSFTESLSATPSILILRTIGRQGRILFDLFITRTRKESRVFFYC